MPPQRVLLVEDDGSCQEIYAAVLEHEGYTVLQARSGEEGVRLARAERPDLILLDIGLPDLDGFAVMEALRSHPETREIPWIVVSVHVTEESRARAGAAGSRLYLSKPLALQALLEAIRHTLRSPELPSPRP